MAVAMSVLAVVLFVAGIALVVREVVQEFRHRMNRPLTESDLYCEAADEVLDERARERARQAQIDRQVALEAPVLIEETEVVLRLESLR